MPIAVAPLSQHPHFISTLADGFAGEWPEWAATLTRAGIEDLFVDGRGSMPVVLVAFEADRALGTIALRQWLADKPMEETPWVRQLWMERNSRGRGVDRLLIAAIEAAAVERGWSVIHAATTVIERLLVRRGWEVFRRIDHGGQPMALLRKRLAALPELRG
jgi:GNAT superfamily N-acetyltransferase